MKLFFVHYLILYLKLSKHQVNIINYVYFFRIFLTHNSLWKTPLKCPHMVLDKLWCKMSGVVLETAPSHSSLIVKIAQIMIWYLFLIYLYIYLFHCSRFPYRVCINDTFCSCFNEFCCLDVIISCYHPSMPRKQKIFFMQEKIFWCFSWELQYFLAFNNFVLCTNECYKKFYNNLETGFHLSMHLTNTLRLFLIFGHKKTKMF